jgi:hypothetical protein
MEATGTILWDSHVSCIGGMFQDIGSDILFGHRFVGGRRSSC